MRNKDQAVLSSLFNTFSVGFEHLLNLPCYVFWKNIQGCYLGYNTYGAINLGYNSGHEIAGKTDQELFPQEIAKNFSNNDQEVIANKKQIFVPEHGVLKDNHPVVFLSYKMPLYDKNQLVVGVFGIAFTRPVNTDNNKVCLSTVELANICNHCPPQKKSICVSLSEQEKISLQYLCQGLTMKLIARRLNISPRTVETYLERAKEKMQCRNKAELILAFLNLCGH